MNNKLELQKLLKDFQLEDVIELYETVNEYKYALDSVAVDKLPILCVNDGSDWHGTTTLYEMLYFFKLAQAYIDKSKQLEDRLEELLKGGEHE